MKQWQEGARLPSAIPERRKGTVKKISFIIIAMFIMFIGQASAKVMPSYDDYIVSASSGVSVSSLTYTNAVAIISSDTYTVKIDELYFGCTGDAWVSFGIVYSSFITGGYDITIADSQPLAPATDNMFSAKANVTISTHTSVAIGSVFRVAANHPFFLDEKIGRIEIPKEYAVIMRVQADVADKKAWFFGRMHE